MRSRLLRIPRYSDILVRVTSQEASPCSRCCRACGLRSWHSCPVSMPQSPIAAHKRKADLGNLLRMILRRKSSPSCPARNSDSLQLPCHNARSHALLTSTSRRHDVPLSSCVAPSSVPVRPKMPEQSCGIRSAAARMAMRQQLAFLFPF